MVRGGIPGAAGRTAGAAVRQDYEPLEDDELLEAWQELTAEDHYNPLRTDLQLLPFARTGAGDSYCFWSNAPGFSDRRW
jgi:hypothetical protein